VIEFTVHGIPAPQGSKTAWGTEANPNTRPWRAAVAAEAAAVRNGKGLLPRDVPLKVRATFYFPRPKHHYRTGSLSGVLKDQAPDFHMSKPDGDKLARAIGDSLTGVVFKDDSQIAVWRIEKRYGDTARVELEIGAA
jgi:Holliday junction resolvase RusA-like endonuclease